MDYASSDVWNCVSYKSHLPFLLLTIKIPETKLTWVWIPSSHPSNMCVTDTLHRLPCGSLIYWSYETQSFPSTYSLTGTYIWRPAADLCVMEHIKLGIYLKQWQSLLCARLRYELLSTCGPESFSDSHSHCCPPLSSAFNFILLSLPVSQSGGHRERRHCVRRSVRTQVLK